MSYSYDTHVVRLKLASPDPNDIRAERRYKPDQSFPYDLQTSRTEVRKLFTPFIRL